MKRFDMVENVVMRENRLGFLHFVDAVVIEGALDASINGLSSHEVGALIVKAYDEKRISNAKASELIEIICEAVPAFRIERYRFDNAYKVIMEYSEKHRAYLSLKHGSKKDLLELIRANGMYID